MTVVVDASVAGQWYLKQQNTTAALRLWDRDLHLMAPDIILPEMANVAWKAYRRGNISEPQAVAMLTRFMAVDMRMVPCGELVEYALDLAIRHGEAVYDCMYLALALREDCPFVTADAAFYKAVEPSFPNHVVWVEDIPEP